MDESNYSVIITALLPLAAMMVVFQVNPYHALVIRGVLGAIAALVYTVLGAADVALTEALVGTLLAITLYAVAVRSSLVLRLGVLQKDLNLDLNPSELPPLQGVVNAVGKVFKDYHLRVEIIPYPDREELSKALIDKDVHAICERKLCIEEEGISLIKPYHITTRLHRIYDIMNCEVLSPITQLSYIDPAAEVHS